MEAPLRIWVSPDDMGPREPVDWSRPFAELGPIGCEGETEYIRADLHDALRAENERMRKALAGRVDPDRGGVVLRNCSEPEPTIRHMVHYYYRTAFSAAESASLAEALFAVLSAEDTD